jgi:hypothetical protein
MIVINNYLIVGLFLCFSAAFCVKVFLGEQEWVTGSQPFAYVVHLQIFLVVCIRTQRDVVTAELAVNLATHLLLPSVLKVPYVVTLLSVTRTLLDGETVFLFIC